MPLTLPLQLNSEHTKTPAFCMKEIKHALLSPRLSSSSLNWDGENDPNHYLTIDADSTGETALGEDVREVKFHPLSQEYFSD